VARITAASSLLLSAQWSVAIKIKPAILHPATLHSSIRSPPLWLKLPALSAETPDNPGNPTTHISNGSPTVICGNCPAIWLTDHRPPTIDHLPSALGLGYLIALAISAAFHSDRLDAGYFVIVSMQQWSIPGKVPSWPFRKRFYRQSKLSLI